MAAFCDFEHFEGEKRHACGSIRTQTTKEKGKMSKKMQFFFEKSKMAHLQNEKFGL